MITTALAQTSLTLFTAMGGWRTVADAVASRAVFLVAYLLTGQVATSALIAVGCVLVLALARVFTDRKYWQATCGLVMVGVSALLAGSTGRGVDFYLPSLVLNAGASAVFLVSMLVRWPAVGLAVGAARGERLGWRRDRGRRSLYQRCTAMFLVKFCVATTVMTPLYLTTQVIPLGVASTLLTAPATGVCAYLSWRMLRGRPDSDGPSRSGHRA